AGKTQTPSGRKRKWPGSSGGQVVAEKSSGRAEPERGDRGRGGATDPEQPEGGGTQGRSIRRAGHVQRSAQRVREHLAPERGPQGPSGSPYRRDRGHGIDPPQDACELLGHPL